MSTDRDVDVEAPTASIAGDPIAVAPTFDSGARGGELRDVLVGARIGKFVVTGILGQGGMGVVVSARDPGLDRVVAIKVLRADHRDGSGRGAHSGARLGREAQAMAKLNHPNVVAVYEVGEHDGSIYIAMERVDGRTLRAWWSAAPRSWREVVEIYVAAGRGLAAAHAAELVHRDFKPDNVLVGADGRPRVTDFGLVAAESRAVDSRTAAGVALDSGLTVQGALLGTPAYMAPEQWLGEPVDARTDQFAFCVALWEALHGERPFGGDTTPLLREAILDGTPRPPRQRVPRWLTAALIRGLARDPGARWPRFAELLDHLTAKLRPGRGRVIAVAAIAAVVIASVAAIVFLRRSSSPPTCAGLDRRLDGVWDDARRGELAEALPAAGVAARLDAYAGQWSEMRLEVCEATRRGEQRAEVSELRVRCLDGAREELERVVSAILDGASAPEASSAVGRLQGLARCADVAQLTALAPRPTEPARAAKLAEIEAVLASAEAEEAMGHHAAALALAQRVHADAEAVGYAPTLAAAELLIGGAQTALDDNVAAERSLRAALRAADAGHDDHLRLEVYVVLIGVVGVDLGRIEDARALLADARGAIVRIASPTGFQARLLALEAELLATSDDHAPIPVMEEAMPMFEAAFGADSRQMAEARYRLGSWFLASGDVDRAEPLLEQSRAVLVEYVGADGAMIAKIDNARAHLRYRRGDLDGAIALQESALAIREKIEGPDSPTLANALYTLGGFYRLARRLEDAAVTLTRALPLIELAHGPEHHRTLMALNELGETLIHLDRNAEATALAVRGVELADRLDLALDVEAKARYLLAAALWDKDRRRALALAHQARDDFRAAGEENSARTVEAWLAAPD